MSYGKVRGNAWKERNKRPWTTTPRELKPRVLRTEPQWTVDQLWITPFREERHYETDGMRMREVWLPVEGRNTAPTGIAVFDEWLRCLSTGRSDITAFCRRFGLRSSDLDGVCFMLTGLRGIDFRMRYMLKSLDALLRYTDLPPADVARHSGFGSPNNLFLTTKREYNQAPMERRRAIQHKDDVGRYRL